MLGMELKPKQIIIREGTIMMISMSNRCNKMKVNLEKDSSKWLLSK
jgi:hypothetical protein